VSYVVVVCGMPLLVSILCLSSEFECSATGKPHSRTLFDRVWLTSFPHVKIMKHDCFSRCTTCVSCSSIIETGTPAQRAEAERQRQYHWDRVTTERRYVNDALYKSLHEEEGFFFCEIDGMDSAKTILPHFHQFDKDVMLDKCLKVHLSCVKYNGARPDDVYFFTDAFPHDSANTITVMYHTLLKVRRMMKKWAILDCIFRAFTNPLHSAFYQEYDRRGGPPKIAHFQLDNTCRENKNKYVLAFSQWAVHMGFAEEIRLSFLPVG
jgi:hypothetical protein